MADAQDSLPRAKRWALLLLCGAAVQQAGWWSLYGDLGLGCGLLGGVMVFVGAVGFDCGVPGHSGGWTRGRGAEVEGWRSTFWAFLFLYAICGAGATGLSAANCPATGTVPASGTPHRDDWVPPAEATPDAAGREYGWGDRFEAGGGVLGIAAACAAFSLLWLLVVLGVVSSELGAMRRGRR